MPVSPVLSPLDNPACLFKAYGGRFCALAGVWKGDTSSDEVTGHAFGWSVASRLIAKDPGDKAEMLSKVRSLPRYIIQNNLTLVDVNGKPTEWGHWEPERLNGLYAVSDDRGNNALEMLGFLAAGLAACAYTS